MPGLYDFIDFAASQPAIIVNGWAQRLELQRGYLHIDREWKPGDRIEMHLPMPPRHLRANGLAKEDLERVAIQRGPLVFCLEWPDNDGHALNFLMPAGAALKSEFDPDRMGGIQTITGNATALGFGLRTFTAIPYYAWANRGMGEMQVWIGRGIKEAWWDPKPPEPIARVTASAELPKAVTGYNDQNDDLRAVFDGADPISSADESSAYFRVRPAAGEEAWIEYEFRRPTQVSSVQVYFYDDRRFCRLPGAWRVLFKDGEAWRRVANRGGYAVAKDRFNAVQFEPVTTVGLRLEIEPQTVQYKSGQIGPPDAMFLSQDIAWREAGVLEWRVG